MALIAAFGVANAQTEQGGWLIGASSNLGFTSQKHKDADDATNTLNFDVKAGYFLMDNLAAGLDFGYFNSKTGDAEAGLTNIGLFARYYFNGTFYAGAGFTSTSVKDGDSGSWINLEAGYPVWMGDNVALEPSLNYSIGGGDLYEDVSSFGLNVGFSLYF